MHPRLRSHVAVVSITALSLILGVLLGVLYAKTRNPVPGTLLRDDHRAGIPVVRLDGVRDGMLTGTMRGDVRVFLGDRVVLPAGSGSLSMPAGSLRDVTTVRVPAGMHFVASRRGKKYYSVTSPSGQKLAASNRVYFGDAAAARRAGFTSH